MTESAPTGINGIWNNAVSAIVRPDLRLTVTHYWWQEWLPLLGMDRWLLVTGLRWIYTTRVPLEESRRHHEITLEFTLPALAKIFGTSVYILSRLLKSEPIEGTKHRRLSIPESPKDPAEAQQAELLRLFIPRLCYTAERINGETKRTGMKLTLILDDMPVPDDLVQVQNQETSFCGVQNQDIRFSASSLIGGVQNQETSFCGGGAKPNNSVLHAQNLNTAPDVVGVKKNNNPPDKAISIRAISELSSARELHLKPRQCSDLAVLAADFDMAARLAGSTGLDWVLKAMLDVDSDVTSPRRYIKGILERWAAAKQPAPEVEQVNLTGFASETGFPFENLLENFIWAYVTTSVPSIGPDFSVGAILNESHGHLAQDIKQGVLSATEWHRAAQRFINVPEETWHGLLLLLAENVIPAPPATLEELLAQLLNCIYRENGKSLTWAAQQHDLTEIMATLAQRTPYQEFVRRFAPQIPTELRQELLDLYVTADQVESLRGHMKNANSVNLLRSWISFLAPVIRQNRTSLFIGEMIFVIGEALTAGIMPPRITGKHWNEIYPAKGGPVLAACWLAIDTGQLELTETALAALSNLTEMYGYAKVWQVLRNQIAGFCVDYQQRGIKIRPAFMVQQAETFIRLELRPSLSSRGLSQETLFQADPDENSGEIPSENLPSAVREVLLPSTGELPAVILEGFRGTYNRFPTPAEAAALQSHYAKQSNPAVWMHAFQQAALSGGTKIPTLRYILKVVDSGNDGSEPRPAASPGSGDGFVSNPSRRQGRSARNDPSGMRPLVRREDMPEVPEEEPLPPLN